MTHFLFYFCPEKRLPKKKDIKMRKNCVVVFPPISECICDVTVWRLLFILFFFKEKPSDHRMGPPFGFFRSFCFNFIYLFIFNQKLTFPERCRDVFVTTKKDSLAYGKFPAGYF